jgi:hypothetical protein
LSDIGLVLNFNADGTATLDAPALDTGAAARSWHGIWLQETDQVLSSDSIPLLKV